MAEERNGKQKSGRELSEISLISCPRFNGRTRSSGSIVVPTTRLWSFDDGYEKGKQVEKTLFLVFSIVILWQ